jgi:nucleotide-binding universal stress UspA family protein
MSEHPVVACYRGLDSADAVQLGAQLAVALQQPLVLARAYSYDPVALSARAIPAPDNARRAKAAQAALRRARAFTQGADIEIREQIVPSTSVADALVDLALDADACLLVVGRDTEGHVTRSLLPRASCPVVVAPLSAALPQTGSIDRVGIAFDGSPAAHLALIAATALARATEARLVLLAVGPTTEHAAAWLHIARLSVQRGVDVASCAFAGDARSALAEATGELDLLVCGSRGRGRPLAALLGSVSAHLAAHAQCPVLVVPPAMQRSAGGPLGVTSSAV